MANIYFPTLYDGQLKTRSDSWDDQLHVVRCSRCWGEAFTLSSTAVTYATAPFKRPGMDIELGNHVGTLTAEYRQYQGTYDKPERALLPLKKSFDRQEKRLLLKNGGKADFWVTNDNRLARRGREYNLVLIDEAAFIKLPEMLMETWPKSIELTLLTTKDHAYILSTPDSADEDSFLHAIYNDPKHGFHQHHVLTSSNPLVPLDELEGGREHCRLRVFRQEFLAEFVDWSADVLFDVSKWFVGERLVDYPETCQAIYAVMDTAVRGGAEHDGIAVVHYAVGTRPGLMRITIPDWGMVQIDGALLEVWMSLVLERLNRLSGQCMAINGSPDVSTEDVSMGSILLQKDGSLGWSVNKVESVLTSKGKDERVVTASGYYYRGLAKISRYAYEKTAVFKSEIANHLHEQASRSHLVDKRTHERTDDLFDDHTYGLIVASGSGDAI